MPRLYIRYQSNAAVSIFTETIEVPSGCQLVVSDLLQAFFSNIPPNELGNYTLKLPPRASITLPDTDGAIIDSNTPLPSDLLLSHLERLGVTATAPFIIESSQTQQQGCGRSYENTFRTAFIKALYNGGKGLTVSSEYFQPDKASRKYTDTTDRELMEKCRAHLKSLRWDEKHTGFEDIEMDCVLRCHVLTPELEEFADPAKILLPKESFKGTPQPFTRKISDNSIDGELPKPNCYIVAEISSDSSKVVQKLRQLEKDLLFLLLRHQMEEKTASIELIIRYAFLVIPYHPMKKAQMDASICKSIVDQKDCLPLLYRLFERGRFARFFTERGMKAVIREISTHVAENTSSAHESSILSLEINAEKVKRERIMTMKEELLAARILPSDPEVQKRVTYLESELARIIIKDIPLPEMDDE